MKKEKTVKQLEKEIEQLKLLLASTKSKEANGCKHYDLEFCETVYCMAPPVYARRCAACKKIVA